MVWAWQEKIHLHSWTAEISEMDIWILGKYMENYAHG